MNFLKNIYIRVVEWFVTCLASATARTMRHLILLKGKDPDYVAAVSAPVVKKYEPMDPARAEQIIEKFSKYPRPSYGVANYPSWVKDLGDHPVLRSRAQFESSRTVGNLPIQKTEPQPPELTGNELLELVALSKSPISEEWAEVVKSTVEAEETKAPLYTAADQEKFAEMAKLREQELALKSQFSQTSGFLVHQGVSETPVEDKK